MTQIKKSKSFIFLISISIAFFIVGLSPNYFINFHFMPLIKESSQNLENSKNLFWLSDFLNKTTELESKIILDNFPKDFEFWTQLTTDPRIKKFPNINKIFINKIKSFNTYYKSNNTIGKEDKGLIKKLREQINQLEIVFKNDKIRTIELYKLRTAEKNYLLREHDQYVNDFYNVYDPFLKTLNKNQNLLQNYEKTFSQIVDQVTFRYIYFNEYLQKRKELNNSLSLYLTNYKNSVEAINQNFETKIKQVINYILITFALSVLLFFLLYNFLNKENNLKTQLILKKDELQKQLIAQEKLASLGGLASGIAHEIKNPLNIIINASQIISKAIKSVDNEEIRQEPRFKMVRTSVEHILNYSFRADEIVKNMLTLSQGGKREFHLVSLSKLIEDTKTSITETLQARHSIDINVETEIINIEDYYCAPNDLAQVISNLLDNSFYAIKEKSLTDNDYIPQISIKLSEDSQNYMLEIFDNGIGIKDEEKERVLEPFHTTKPPGKGTGLGLSFAIDVINAHLGEFILESKEGEYTKTKIFLPKKVKHFADAS